MKFKKYISEQLNYIPDFIDVKVPLHFEIWTLMVDINDIILELISQLVLTKRKLYGIMKRFYDYINYTMSILEEKLKLTFSIYYTAVLKWILEEALKSEEYETAENLKEFDLLYQRKIEIDVNEIN